MTIKYIQSKVASRPTFRTEKFGNLLSDTYQAEVSQSSDGTWTAWRMNWSRKEDTEYIFGLKSKRSAICWANGKLREVGVNVK